ncbi:hypothetical protein ATK36_5431 [Amycolatopsis sulphurea]|uniref:Uncharacterized protein n=1 Tax=Amycolatopsis sulphurea TaxID=76022 RepID=A0A2A9FGD3_9PSEU|nr:hypothetical protein ATK36_5431 [Amycolatopsis sulphurea]
MVDTNALSFTAATATVGTLACVAGQTEREGKRCGPLRARIRRTRTLPETVQR